MPKGRLSWSDELVKENGFGIITPDDGGKDLRILIDELRKNGKLLTKGQLVEYELEAGVNTG